MANVGPKITRSQKTQTKGVGIWRGTAEMKTGQIINQQAPLPGTFCGDRLRPWRRTRKRSRRSFVCRFFSSSSYKMDHKQRVREASARYSRNHTSDIIAHKTLQQVRRTGRIPRPATIEAHGIDEEQLREELYEFTKRHPDALATKRICKVYQIL